MLESSLTLLEKRKLAKLLGFAAVLATSMNSELNTSESAAIKTLGDLLRKEGVTPESRVFQLISYAACRCSSLREVDALPIQSALKILESLRESINHLNGRKCPFVLPLWGSSELSQAACRKAAVFNCTQIFETTKEIVQSFNIQFTGFVELSPDHKCSVFKCTWLLDRPVLGLSGNVLITIPPSSDLIPDASASSVNILQLTSDTNCCPTRTCKLKM